MFKNLFSRSKQSREEAFWSWFAVNSEAYLAFTPEKPGQMALINQLGAQLNRVQKGLTFEIGTEPEATQRELVISADGHRELFPAVRSLVDAAPELAGWQILAFRQRKGLASMSLQTEAGTFGPEQMWFQLRSESELIGIDVFMAGIPDPGGRAGLTVAFLMLDCALGEQDMETRVGTISTHPAPTDPEAQELKPFLTLPEEFDALYTLMHGPR